MQTKHRRFAVANRIRRMPAEYSFTEDGLKVNKYKKEGGAA